MKKLSLSLLVITLVIGFVFNLLIPSLSAQAAEKVFELKLSSHKPPMAAPIKVYKEWAKKVEEATNGRVKIDIYSASSLVKLEDIISSTKRGICDFGDLVLYQERQRFPLTAILDLPYMNLGNPRNGMKIWVELEKKFPQMKAEHKDFKVLNRTTSSAGHLHMRKKEVRIPEDLKGTKIIAGGHLARVLKSIGASPVNISVPDWYSSLDRGLVEGTFLHYYGVYETKIYELLPYHTDIGHGYALHTEEIIMNLDSWNKLPTDIQKVFDDLSPWVTEQVWDTIDDVIAEGRKVMKNAGHTFIKCTPEEVELWRKVSLPIHEEWIKEQEDKGLPARAIYEEALRLSNEYKD